MRHLARKLRRRKVSEQRRKVELKTPAEIATMHRAGRLLHRVMMEVKAAVQPGVTSLELDKLARTRIKEAKAKPAFLGLYGFPGTICASINEEVVHGIPSKRVLKEGDIISVDCGAIIDGFYSDMAFTVAVGKVAPEVEKLMAVTRESLYKAIAAAQPGNRLGDIGHAVQSTVEPHGFSVVYEYAGHGLGRSMHEDPRVENFGRPGVGERLRPGMVIAIEPMVNLGAPETETLGDDWTVVSKDGSPSAHFEHTVAITAEGPKILTLDEELEAP